ncbi:hypothetical protein NQ315_010709 [Exocentrus adspersus]|uniref:Trafficking protein particle complex subunit 11 n=1 Tax=Exocentrus adspersus TaxID=1586481 RepID=A0AAV8VTY9_9CUCU|nr:hypothetical protein NQ315_010709 [Exocentrus adspersus]
MQVSNVQDSVDLPPELCVKPLALVGVSGLDTLNNAIHKAIWETFSSNRRVERAPVFFKLISNAYEFPVCKPKRSSYDWYIPKGILKKNWMNKHLYEIPAVIVIFYDLDWNDPQWSEKMIECASRVQSMRAALEGRNSRITVVLIQNTLPLPAGEDLLASERAIALCSSCELNSQSLFVLPHGDHLQGYAIRLENAFYEFAQTYYHNEAKNVKSHKEHINKNTHQYLFVRHQFKMGFLNELKQDVHTAHKHYTHAYNNLLEIRIVDTNALEIRTVAGFINYKLCRLMFTLNLPRDAISQFKAHIDRFKNRMGFQELSFEHYAWLSKQYSVFADVFDEAVKQGLPAVQTQHPGIYYQQAAQFAIMRKKSCLELCSSVKTYPHPDPLEGASHLEFYGQRPWRPGKVSAEPPDPQLEQNGIRALQFLETQVNHSTIIISLYGLAVAQYKTYRCPRTRRHLVLQMADEYYNSKDYGKSLTLLTHMLWDFRTERWSDILSQILEKALRCAYLTANTQDYVLLAVEILGSSVCISLDDKRRIYENLNRVLKKQIPFGDPKLPQDVLQNAIVLWQPVFSTAPLLFSLDVSNIITCVETKARFTKNKYEVDQNVTIEVYIRNTCPFLLTFSSFSVTINTPDYNSEIGATNLEAKSLHFHSNEVKRFVIEFVPDSNDVNKEIQIGSINILLGNPLECCLDLKYTSMTNVSSNYPELLHFKRTNDELDFGNIRPLSSATIVPRNSKLNVNFVHHQPALLGEWYEIKIDISNDEQYSIKDMKIEVDLGDEASNAEVAMQPKGSPQKLPLFLSSPSSLQTKEQTSATVFVRAHDAGKYHLQVKITYTLDSEKPVFCIKSDKIVILVVQPFEVTVKFLSLMMEETDRFYTGEEFGVMTQLNFNSPWPIFIEDTNFEFLTPVNSVEGNLTSQVAGMLFNNEEMGVEIRLGVCNKTLESEANIGQYTVKWHRENGHSTTTQITISGLPCESIPLGLKMIAPAHGFVRTPMVLSYHLQNRSQQLIQLDVFMEASEAFMFAGYKQFQISILPHSTRVLNYNMYPLIAGNVAIPRLNLTVPENDSGEPPVMQEDQLKRLIERSIPSHIYVMPQVKGKPTYPIDMVTPQEITSN